MVIVFGPKLNGMPDEALPELTGFPFTVIVADGSLLVGVTITDEVAYPTVAV